MDGWWLNGHIHRINLVEIKSYSPFERYYNVEVRSTGFRPRHLPLTLDSVIAKLYSHRQVTQSRWDSGFVCVCL